MASKSEWCMCVFVCRINQCWYLLLTILFLVFFMKLVSISIKSWNAGWADYLAETPIRSLYDIPQIYRAALLQAHGVPVIYHQVAVFMYRITESCIGSEFLHCRPLLLGKGMVYYFAHCSQEIKNLISEDEILQCLIIKKWRTFKVNKNLMAHP